MQSVAKGVWRLRGWPRDLINVYLVEDVLIDTATRWAKWRIFNQLGRRPVRLVALTHCHPDHQGSARAVCEHFGAPLACHEAEVAATEGRAPMAGDHRLLRIANLLWSGPPFPVGKVLREGDEVAGFRVVPTPGHTPGHVVYFRDSDRVAIAGDLLVNIHFVTRQPGLRETPHAFSADPAQNRRSIQTLIALKPRVVCFGHGPPLWETKSLQRFADG